MKKKCKNTNCQRILPDTYKYKYCENCRNERAYKTKKVATTMIGMVPVILKIVNKKKS